MKNLFCVALVWFIVSPAMAAPEDGKECVAVSNDIVRLACFDRAFAGSLSKPNAALSQWSISEETSAVDDSKTLYASTKATQVTSSFSGNAEALLVLRCSKGETSVFVAGNAYFSDVSNVTIRLDGGQPDIQTHMWDVSTTGKAIGLWGGRNPVNLAQSFKNNGKFVIRVEGRHTFEAVFDLGEVDPATAKISDMCGWKYYQ